MNILVINVGSSSLKFQLSRVSNRPDSCETLGRGSFPLDSLHENLVISEAIGQALDRCVDHPIDAIGHRVVHGGGRFTEPARVTDRVVCEIRELAQFAPIHNERAATGIEATMRRFPDVPNVAVFDTAFHKTLPLVAAHYAIPHKLALRHGLRRYGFHGIAHASVSRRLLNILERADTPDGTRLISCHLGNGASVCAIQDGRSVDTSMGLTPMEGLMMGTRCGDIDPGLVLHLSRGLGMNASRVNDLLNHDSGLKGVSNLSHDMRELETASANGHTDAEFALEMFAYRIQKYIGAYAAALGGVDAISWSGGIGQHSAAMRSRILSRLEFLGVRLDPVRNAEANGDVVAQVTQDRSPVASWVIPAAEEEFIARQVLGFLCVVP